jgi:hypothetical protein
MAAQVKGRRGKAKAQSYWSRARPRSRRRKFAAEAKPRFGGWVLCKKSGAAAAKFNRLKVDFRQQWFLIRQLILK